MHYTLSRKTVTNPDISLTMVLSKGRLETFISQAEAAGIGSTEEVVSTWLSSA
jgi:hypothetical protein